MSSPLKYPASFWESENIILEKGQYGFDEDSNQAKLGDGETPWNSLNYFPPNGDYSPASGTDNYTIDYARPLIYGLYPGLTVVAKIGNGNTGACTAELILRGGISTGQIAIKKLVTFAMESGDFLAGGIYRLTYDGTNFQVEAQGLGQQGFILLEDNIFYLLQEDGFRIRL